MVYAYPSSEPPFALRSTVTVSMLDNASNADLTVDMSALTLIFAVVSDAYVEHKVQVARLVVKVRASGTGSAGGKETSCWTGCRVRREGEGEGGGVG